MPDSPEVSRPITPAFDYISLKSFAKLIIFSDNDNVVFILFEIF